VPPFMVTNAVCLSFSLTAGAVGGPQGGGRFEVLFLI